MAEQIKILEKQDIESMRDIFQADNMAFDSETLDGFINDNHSHGFIAKLDDRSVGFAYAYDMVRPDGKVLFYIHSIDVLPKYQGRGIATRLMVFALDCAKSKGCYECFLITEKSNQTACRLYENVGGKVDSDDSVVYVYNTEMISE